MSDDSPARGGLGTGEPGSGAPADVVLRVQDGVLEGWNPAAEALLGLTDTDRGRPAHDVLRDRVASALSAELQRERIELASEAAELWHRAFHDPLTNLANRNLLRERAASALERGTGAVALLLIELDGLKAINDALGHTVGDRLLIELAQRLTDAVGARGTVARPGGGFAVLLHEVADETEAIAVAEAVIAHTSHPFEIEGRVLFVTPRIGISLHHGEGGDTETLFRNVDVALYHARSETGGTYACFEETMHTAALDRLELEADLRAAVERNQLVLHFQPIAGLRSGQILGVEALVRWMHPERGMVPPMLFIPLAEETGLVVAIGEWVLREACRQTVAWHRAFPDRPPVSVAVNLAASQLQLPGFADTVAAVLADTGLRAEDLVLEITETQIMDNVDGILPNLGQLQDLGVRMSIDDFGTGYSSLSRLRSLPVDELKIDKSFVQGIHTSTDQAPLVAAIVAMAHGLNLQVVGEGVETAAQLDFLLRAGCDRVQGYLLGRPVPADVIGELISQPVLVLRLAAAAAVLGAAGDDLDIDIAEALASVLAEASSSAEVVDGLLDLVMRATGLDGAYVTRIEWSQQEQTVVGTRGECGLHVGERFSWAGAATPDVYGDGRNLRGLETYLSVPVVGAAGGLLGTLCAVSAAPRTLARTQLAAMEVLGRLLGEELTTDRRAATVRVAG
jgi:diguanylate cyclase (GGDEF)-like protein